MPFEKDPPNDINDTHCRKLPEEYDSDIYARHNPDLARLDPAALSAHYTKYGRLEGRIASAVNGRESFIDLIDRHADTLEIGPYLQPCLSKELYRCTIL